MSATIRSLRPLMRTASPAMRRLPAFAGHARTYKQPARDLMTGEVTQLPDIDHTTVKVDIQHSPKQKPHHSKLIFGQTFTDHMLTIPWNSNTGWGTPEIKPYAPLCLDPSATVFHYAFTLFEGMKAYRQEDDTVRLFRPDKNMARMNKNFDGESLTELIKKLVMVDKDWIPKEKGYSLYIRPTLIGTQAQLGVGPNSDALLFVICSPVGPYYPTGFKPVSLLATTKYTRAWPGGSGGFKLGANYAPGVVPASEAAKAGYGQILWLSGDDHTLTEVGTMNLFIALKTPEGGVELVTAPLGDLVLPGVTRDSVLNLCRGHIDGKSIPGLPSDLKVSERKITMGDLVEAEKNGSLLEVFGAGTAAIVSAVDKIGYEGRDIHMPTGPEGMGPIAKAMYDTIVGIQTGEIESDWSVVANDAK